MKTIASVLVTIVLMGIAGYVGYAWGYKACEKDVNDRRIFPGVYNTLIEEHREIADRHLDALNMIDQYDSFIKAMGDNDFERMVRHLLNVDSLRKKTALRDSIFDVKAEE